jgi:hypothetical protein
VVRASENNLKADEGKLAFDAIERDKNAELGRNGQKEAKEKM